MIKTNLVKQKSEIEKIELLMEKANVQGYLTSDDVIEIYPRMKHDHDKLEMMTTLLRNRGIEFLDQFEDAEIDSKPAKGRSNPLTDMDPLTEVRSLNDDDSISLYLKETAKVPLLTAQEEMTLAKQIEKGEQAALELERLNGNNTPQKRQELENHINEGIRAREHLIKANTRLVVSIAKRYVGRGVPFLDLIQEGNLGLMKAVTKFEYIRGFRFSTYATWWIRQTITRSIADQGRTIRVPVHMADRIRQLYRASHQLEQRLGREPTIDELAAEIKQPAKKVGWMLRVSWLPLSLESPVNDSNDEETELGMFVEDEITPTPMESAYTKMLGEKIESILGSLPPREERILRLRFGLENGQVYTLEEVGRKFGLTRERIRQLEGKALRRLRQPRRARHLREFL